ncbi:hypothetical protein HP570_06290 [Brevibacillus sp. RS1.1]|uniref:hypothetical protein n=1 Tax=Brevibacillus sp. RS1.1 TaxID=2738982 RepID=UPI00156BA047|nr:hypothetical protein [Brevibacillus sp. RS1.1]NRR01824.1 hypothetical protein [Brevibacillus sp. RS1.1]
MKRKLLSFPILALSTLSLLFSPNVSYAVTDQNENQSVSTQSVDDVEDKGDGFRSAIKQSEFGETVVGGEANLKVPGNSYINAIAEKIYPEFFITINSEDGSTFDGGVILEGKQWKAVIFGGGVWKEIKLPSITGKTVKLKFGGEIDERGEYIVKLHVINTSGKTLGSVFVDKDTPTYDKNGNLTGKLGWLAENPYWRGLKTVGFELNMVPKSDKGYYHQTTDNYGKRAFFQGAEFSIAVPVKKAGGTLSLDKFNWTHIKNCDDTQYDQSEVEKIVYDVSNKTYLFTTINFNNLP